MTTTHDMPTASVMLAKITTALDSGRKVWISTAQVANKIMLLTRTTRIEDCARPTDGMTIFYTDLDRSKIDVHRIPKMGRKAVDSNAIFIDGLFIPEEEVGSPTSRARIEEAARGHKYALVMEPGRDGEVPSALAPPLGRLADVAAFVKARRVHLIYLSLPMASQPRIKALLDALQDTTASVYFVPDMFVTDLIQGHADSVCGLPVISVCETPLRGPAGLAKRASDLVLSIAILLLLSPLLLLIAVAVKLTSPGPVIFRQRRYGLDGEEIVVYKFRSMTVAEDGAQVPQARRGDPRVTRVGALLRRTTGQAIPGNGALRQDIARQFAAYGQVQLAQMDQAKQPLRQLGPFQVQGDLAADKECQTARQQLPEHNYRMLQQRCDSPSGLYIMPKLYAGQMVSGAFWLQGKGLGSYAMSRLMERRLNQLAHVHDEESPPGRWQCSEQRLRGPGEVPIQLHACRRRIEKLPGLSDFRFRYTPLIGGRDGLIVAIGLSGYDNATAQAVLRRSIAALRMPAEQTP